MELAERASHTLKRIENAVLATVAPDGLPWNSPLFVAYDETLTVFWSSRRDAAHSINLAANPQVLLVVFDSSSPDESGAAVYIRGSALVLTDGESVQRAENHLAQRKKKTPKTAAEFSGQSPHRVYALSPETVWTNVVKRANGHYFDERIAIDVRTLARHAHS
jgi:general stress protein 26